MNPRVRITNDKFSIRICKVAEAYGFKSIGPFHKFLKQCRPSAKLGLEMGHVRAAELLKEIGSIN